MKIIVLHDRYSNEPIIVRVDAINVISKIIDDNEEEFSSVYVSQLSFAVNEHIDVIMAKINNAEREHN